MKKLKAFAASFHRNVIVKGKYKSFLAIFYDASYRRDLNKLYLLKKNCTKSELRPIDIKALKHGHKVIYPAYALSLFATPPHKLPPIRVVFDPSENLYVVIDGNHRLPALLTYARHSNYEYITCEVLS